MRRLQSWYAGVQASYAAADVSHLRWLMNRLDFAANAALSDLLRVCKLHTLRLPFAPCAGAWAG